MTSTDSSAMTRRTLLAGVAAGLVLVACDNADDDNEAEPDDGKGLALVRFFDDPTLITGTNRRLVFGLAQADGTLRQEGPESVEGQLFDPSGVSLGAVTGTRRAKDLFRQYYLFRVDVPDEGIYTLQVTSAGETADSSFTVVKRGALAFPSPGDVLTPFETPTMANPRGVNPVCTREPACSFHDRTLAELLADGVPIAYLVGTPAHCQTGVCGPMLDVMLSVRDQYPTIAFLHAEVYADNVATTVAPAVVALGLTFEPVLYLVGADGRVADRLDVIFDATELAESLDALAR